MNLIISNPFPENRDHVKIVTQNDGYDFDCLALGIHCVWNKKSYIII